MSQPPERPLVRRSHLPAPDLEPEVVHQHPMAYLLGLQGIALLRTFTGEHDRAYAEARLAEVRQLLDHAAEIGGGHDVPVLSTAEVYDGWAPTYDGPRNLMLEREQAVVWPLLDAHPPGRALDVACGTGRHAVHLAAQGHQVAGLDVSPVSIAIAREKLPDADLRVGDWTDLPWPDDTFDLVVSGLALAHARDLAPVIGEMARVLRPGGHLVLSDSRALFEGARLYPMVFEDAEGRPGFMRAWQHRTSAYLGAALPLGLRPTFCEERVVDRDMVDETGTELYDEEPVERWTARDEPPDIYALHPWAPAATNAAYRGKPSSIVWEMRLEG